MSQPQKFEDIYGLSPLQKGMLFHSLYAPEEGAYFEQLTCRFRGRFDEAAFANAWRELGRRHSILRTAFVTKGQREPLQVVHREKEIPWAQLDWRGLDTPGQAAKLAEFLAEDRRQGFELNRAPLMRLTTIRTGEEEREFVWSHHHLLMDGWSLPLLLHDFFALYEAGCAGRTAALPPTRPYGDYIAWLQQRDAGKAEAFWTRTLAGFREPTPLGIDRPGTATGPYRETMAALSARETEELQAAALAHQVTLNTLVQGAWAVVLSRYGGSDDVLFGITVAGRPPELSGADGMVGLFINTLPRRIVAGPEETVGEWLRRLQEQQLAEQEFEHAALSDIQKWSEVAAGRALFESLFVFENYPLGEAVPPEVAGLRIEEVRFVEHTNYPLTLAAIPGRELAFKFTFDSARIDAASVERLGGHLRTVLGQLGDPARRLADLTLLTAPERAEALRPTAVAAPTPPAPTLQEWFQQVVERRGYATALTFGAEAISYGELNRRANRLAHRLIREGVGPETFVGLYLERSPAVVVGILGILKAGGAYLPLDPAYPAERVHAMIEDSGIAVLVTEGGLHRKIAATLPAALTALLLDDPGALTAEPDGNPPARSEASHPAYMIYTSGSTGKPKGCLITQGNATRLFTATDAWFGFGADDVWTLFHSHAFDFSVWEIWGALLYGGRLVGVPYYISREPAEFHALAEREGVTVLNQTPSAFRQFIKADAERNRSGLALRHVIFGGEALELQSLRPWFDRHGDAHPRLVNMYGITETTVHVTYRPIALADLEAGRGSVIGEPIPDLELSILDRFGQPVPVGIAGELHVGGAGLARGYWQRPELTAQRFIADPSGAAARLYRSGDLARWLPDGDIEYLGRIDEQVKVRGFRIELGEIEAALHRHPGVAEAAVLLREAGAGTGEKRIVAYVVAKGEGLADLRADLGRQLPDYMVPSHFVTVERLPLTPNGKLDRRALPDPAVGEGADRHVAPRTPQEEALAGIWREVLRADRVGVEDNYFALGGDSILSIVIRSKARERGIEFSLQALFERPTIASLLGTPSPTPDAAPAAVDAFGLLGEEDRRKARGIAGVEDAYPLSLLQLGMAFHTEFAGGSSVYHDIFSSHLRAPWNEEALRAALAGLARLHPVLRTSFALTGFSEPIQLVHAEVPAALALDIADLTALSPAQAEQEVGDWTRREKENPFAWSRAPLWRVQVHRRTAETLQFSFSIHHAIIDGWSISHLLTGLFRDYLHRLGQGGAALPETAAPALGFRDFIALEREAIASPQARAFWDGALEGAAATPLPAWPAAAAPRLEILECPVALPEETSTALLRLAQSRNCPVHAVLLAAHLRVLSFLTGADEVMTGLVTNGRPEGDGGERIAGLFLNTLPFRLRLREEPWHALIDRVAATERTLWPHRRVPIPELQKRHGGHPLFDTDFNFVHFHVFNRMTGEIEVLGSLSVTETSLALAANFQLDPATGRLGGDLAFDLARIPAGQARTIVQCYETALRQIAADPAAPYLRQSPLPARERERLVHSPSRTAQGAALHAPFAAQVRRAPSTPALSYEGATWTYDALNRRANRLAHYLMARGIGPDDLVAVCMDRSADLVVALLGILKAGAAYLPLDPDYPPDRIEFMLRDSRAPVLLTEHGLVPGGMVPEAERIAIDRDWDRIAPAPDTDPDRPVHADSLAYMIYTSGSTGRPKGTAISHRAIANHMEWMQREFPLGPGDSVLQKTPYSFDASVWEFWAPLGAGATLVMARPGGHRDPAYLIETVIERGITTLQLVPTLLEFVLQQPRAPECRSLKRIFAGGEALRGEVARRCRQLFPHAELVNLYGPTETSIDASFHRVGEARADDRAAAPIVPIGRAISNLSLYILNERLQPVPAGTPGELHIGGAGLARGYHRRPAQTAERFLPDPFSTVPGARMYASGDLARLRPDGTVDYLGRQDSQVKVHGMRIELGEIESVLNAVPGVLQTAAAVRHDKPGEARLVAYVSTAAPGPGVAALREAAQKQLPPHLVPAAFVLLDRLPVNPSGKVDRAKLPAPEAAAQPLPAAAPFRPPGTGLEKKLAEIWRETLQLAEVGLDDNFFDLGGDSILSLRLVSRAAALGLRLTPKLIFDRQTIGEIAAGLEGIRPGEHRSASPEAEPVTGQIPLTPIQRSFFDLQAPRPHHWNQAVLLQTEAGFSPELFADVWKTVAANHPALSFRYAPGTGEALPPAEAGEIPFTVIDLGALPASSQAAEIERQALALQRSLDIGNGPLGRAAYLHLGADRPGRLLLVFHHLAIDGVSWRILLEELASGYGLEKAGRVFKPLAEGLPFAAWARRLARHADGAEARGEIPYWTDARWKSSGTLPTDRSPEGAPNRERDAARLDFSLTAEETGQLLHRARAAYRTEINHLLLAALARALGEWSEAEQVLIALEGHGREDLGDGADLSRTVGWFTSVFPVLLPGGRARAGWGERLPAVKDALRAVPRRGAGYGLLRYLSPDASLRQTLAELPSPQLSFNYLGQLDLALAGGGPFAAAPESAGPEHDGDAPRAYLIDVGALVSGGRLRVGWTYAANRFDAATVARLGESFLAHLRALIAHCCGQERVQLGLSPADFPLARLDAAGLEKVRAVQPDPDDIWTLSPLQEGILLHAVHEPGSGVYVQQLAADLTGAIHLPSFHAAWNRLLERHAVLRAAFVWDDLEGPRQIVAREAQIPLEIVDWSHHGADSFEPSFAAWIEADRVRPFDLARPPLMRLALFRRDESSFRLVWTHHHLLLDGWSIPIVLQELQELYAAELSGHPAAPPAAGDYRSYIAWLQRRDAAGDEPFWRESLRGYAEPLALAIGAAPETGAGLQETFTWTVPPDETARLAAFARAHRLTLSTLVQGAWAVLLARYHGVDEVLFGVTVSGRPPELPGSGSAVGLFINTLPLRVPVPAAQGHLAWLHRLQERQRELGLHEATRLVDIHGWSEVPRDRPLFESVVIFENYPSAAAPAGTRPPFEIGEFQAFEKNNLPLSLYAIPGERLQLRLVYDARRFSGEALAVFGAHLGYLLGELAQDECPIETLGLVPAGERSRTLSIWEPAPVAQDAAPLPVRIAALAAERPAEIAVTCGGEALTRAGLEEKAEHLARHLRSRGVGAESLVGLHLDRSLEMVWGLLGILKAGAAYVPLDPSFPAERLRWMVEDSRPALLLTQRSLREGAARLADDPASVLCLDAAGEWQAGPHSPEPGRRRIDPDQLAYVLFTSGSTGRPKGVQITHRALSNFLAAFAQRPGLGADDVLLAITTLSFDIAGLELFLPLLAGARLAVASRETASDALLLARAIGETGATVLQATPATWRLLLAGGWQPARPLKAWCGGEAMPPDLAADLLRLGCHLWNFYGPTETTIWSAIRPVSHPAEARSVGEPIANTTAYLLDRSLRPVPPGAPGELYLGGAGLSRGYLRRPALTAQAFVPDPFSPAPGARLYRTGDLARRGADGGIEFLGRIDSQVKIRGFRIELGEIEAALREQPGIAHAVVTAREDQPGDRRLAAYLVAAGAAGTAPAPEELQLRKGLAHRLPDYMVPATFTFLAALPMTPNGKLDRRALPAPSAATSAEIGVAPRDDIERVLAGIWHEVLGGGAPGVTESFFALGGHSLKAAGILARIRKIFQVELTLRDVLEHDTVASQAATLRVREARPGQAEKIARAFLKLQSLTPEERARLRRQRETAPTS